MINKTQRTTFEKDLQSAWRNGRYFYARRVPDVSKATILAEIRSGAAKPRKRVDDKRHGVEMYFDIPALNAQRKKEELEAQRRDKKAAGFDRSYYIACDAISRTESHLKAAKIVADFKALAKR